MDIEYIECESDEPFVLVSPAHNQTAAIEPEVSGTDRCTLAEFAGAVGAALMPYDIAIRLAESRDGTRAITAWRCGAPDRLYSLSADSVGICPGNATTLASVIRRTVYGSATDPALGAGHLGQAPGRTRAEQRA